MGLETPAPYEALADPTRVYTAPLMKGMASRRGDPLYEGLDAEAHQLENPPSPCSTKQGSYTALVPLALKSPLLGGCKSSETS